MNGIRIATIIAVLSLIAFGTIFAEGLFYLAALPLAGWLCIGTVAPPPQYCFTAERIITPGFPKEGEPVRVALKLRNCGSPADLVRIKDMIPRNARIVEGRREWKGSMDRGDSMEIGYTLMFARGVHRFENPALCVEDPFTAVQTEIALECFTEMYVSPAKIDLRHITAQPEAVRPFGGISRTKRCGGGAEFSKIRDYSAGDPVRSINWRAEALWGKPVVNVFEEERAIDVGILLDARSVAYETPVAFEAAVQVAASYADSFLAAGNRVSFMMYGSVISWIPPGAGRLHRFAIMKTAARAELGSHAVFEHFDAIPPKIFPPKSAILVVSPILREDIDPLRCLKALGYSVSVAHIEGNKPAYETRPKEARHDSPLDLALRIERIEEEITIRQMLRYGIRVVRLNIASDSPQVRFNGERI